MPKEPFTVAIPEETLTDLRERLARTRWSGDFANPQWEYGTNRDYLSSLAELQHLGSLLLRSHPQSLATGARPHAGGRSAHGNCRVFEGSHLDAAAVGRTVL